MIHDDGIPSEIREYLVCLTCDRSWIFKTKILMCEVKIIDEGFAKQVKHLLRGRIMNNDSMILVLHVYHQLIKSMFGDQLRDGACSEENKKGQPINVFDLDSIN